MSVEVMELKARIASLEKQMNAQTRTAAAKPRTAAQMVLAEIEDLEKQMGDEAECASCTGADENLEPAVAAELEDDEFQAAIDEEEGKTASLTAPGIEDECTQDRLTAVEELEHGTELATDPSTRESVASYVGRLKKASARLDRVATYLEKHGKKTLAYRIDRIADAIDQKIETVEEK